jgi:hypothetical protein
MRNKAMRERTRAPELQNHNPQAGVVPSDVRTSSKLRRFSG